jgi:uncharacterized protein (TIGR02246 family)
MRIRHLLAMAIGLAMLSTTATAADAMAGDCWNKAFVASDADAVALCYAPDAVMWFPGGPMASGRDAIREGYKGFFTGNTIKSAVLSPMGGTTAGDTAVAWGTYTIVMVSKESGAEVTEVGRYTDVQKKIDGRWQYVVDHASDDPPPVATDAAASSESSG